MLQNINALVSDESGFIVSAELVLVATLLVVGIIVGLSEVQHAVVTELSDVGEAVGSLNQSYFFSGFSKDKSVGDGTASFFSGSVYSDSIDECDGNGGDITCDAPQAENQGQGQVY